MLFVQHLWKGRMTVSNYSYNMYKYTHTHTHGLLFSEADSSASVWHSSPPLTADSFKPTWSVDFTNCRVIDILLPVSLFSFFHRLFDRKRRRLVLTATMQVTWSKAWEDDGFFIFYAEVCLDARQRAWEVKRDPSDWQLIIGVSVEVFMASLPGCELPMLERRVSLPGPVGDYATLRVISYNNEQLFLLLL